MISIDDDQGAGIVVYDILNDSCGLTIRDLNFLKVLSSERCLLLDGVNRLTDGGPVFQAVPAPTAEQLQILLTRIITRLLKMLTRQGALIEEEIGIPSLADPDGDPALAPLHAAACTYRIALGPRAGQKVLTWKDSSAAPRQSRDAAPPRL